MLFRSGVMCERPVVFRLDKCFRGLFTLKELVARYRWVGGDYFPEDQTLSNFRRKVEGAEGFLLRTSTTANEGSTTPRRGRPEQLYTAGPAQRIEPPLVFRGPRSTTN